MTKRTKKSAAAAPLPPSVPSTSETGRYAVFDGCNDFHNELFVVARVLDLVESRGHTYDRETTYDYETVFAFDRAGTLVRDFLGEVRPVDDSHDGLHIWEIIESFRTFTGAFIFAHGLLAEGNRWQAAT